MKAIRLLIAALAVALGIPFAHVAQAQQPNSTIPASSLPVFIPTADTVEGLYECMLTNQNLSHPNKDSTGYYMKMAVNLTNVVAELIGTKTNFSSYASFHACLRSNILTAVSSLLSKGMDPNTPIRLQSQFWQDESFGPYGEFSIDTNGTPLGSMTGQWFDTVGPRVFYVNQHVSGLNLFSVIVSNSTSYYSNGWSAVSGSAFPKISGNAIINPYPPEKTTTDWLVLNPWYLLRTNHMRLFAGSTDDAGTYTQLGPRITPATLQSSPDSTGSIRVQASYAAGSDTDFLCSTDMVNWVTVPTTVLSSNVTSETVLISKSSPTMFFRTASH